MTNIARPKNFTGSTTPPKGKSHLILEAGGTVQAIGWIDETAPDAIIQFAATELTDATWAISATKVYRARDGINFDQRWAGATNLTLQKLAADPVNPRCFVAGMESSSGGSNYLKIYAVTSQAAVTTLYTSFLDAGTFPNPRVSGLAATDAYLFVTLRSDNVATKEFLVAPISNLGSFSRFTSVNAANNIAAYGNFCYYLVGSTQVYRSQALDPTQTLIATEATSTYNTIAADYSRDTVYISGVRTADSLGIYTSITAASSAPVVASFATVNAMTLTAVSTSPNIDGDLLFGSNSATEPLLTASDSATAPVPLAFSGTVTAPVTHVSLDESGTFTYGHLITAAQGAQVYTGATLSTTGAKNWTLATHSSDSTLSGLVGITPSGYLYRGKPGAIGIPITSWTAMLNPVIDATGQTYDSNQSLAVDITSTKLYICSSQGVIGVSSDMGATRVPTAAAGSPRVEHAGGFIGGLASNTSIYCSTLPAVEQAHVSTDDWATSTPYVWFTGKTIKEFMPTRLGSSTYHCIATDAAGINCQVLIGNTATIATAPTVLYTEPDTTAIYTTIMQPANAPSVFFIGRTDGKIRATTDNFATAMLADPPVGVTNLAVKALCWDARYGLLYVCYAEGIFYAPPLPTSSTWDWIHEPADAAPGTYTGAYINRTLNTGVWSAYYGNNYSRTYRT